MPKLTIIPSARRYTFSINGYDFIVDVEHKDYHNAHPIDILICELEAVIGTIKGTPRFKLQEPLQLKSKPFELPPVNPENTDKENDGNENKEI